MKITVSPYKTTTEREKVRIGWKCTKCGTYNAGTGYTTEVGVKTKAWAGGSKPTDIQSLLMKDKMMDLRNRYIGSHMHNLICRNCGHQEFWTGHKEIMRLSNDVTTIVMVMGFFGLMVVGAGNLWGLISLAAAVVTLLTASVYTSSCRSHNGNLQRQYDALPKEQRAVVSDSHLMLEVNMRIAFAHDDPKINEQISEAIEIDRKRNP